MATKTEFFTVSTQSPWTCPPNVTSVLVEVQGAGGGSQAPGGNNTSVAGGGGGGYSRATMTVVPDNTYAYIVGQSAAGIAGEDSYWVNISTILAKGGAVGPSAGTGGIGGAEASGVVPLDGTKYSGGNGANQLGTTGGGGGGGGASDQGNGTTTTVTAGGAGAATYGGNGGNGSTGAGAGSPGNNYGGGAGGGRRSGATPAAQPGAGGYILLTYTVVDPVNVVLNVICNM